MFYRTKEIKTVRMILVIKAIALSHVVIVLFVLRENLSDDFGF